MNPDHERIVRWIGERAKRDFPDDVALVLLYGSHADGTTHRLSDVDCFFIPATPRGYAMACTFIAGGIGYDVFPMSWKRVEDIADLKEPLLPLIGDAVVLYARSGADLERYRACGRTMTERLADPAYRHAEAVRRMTRAAEAAADARRESGLHGVRRRVGEAFLNLSDAIALDQGTYFRHGLKRHVDDLSRLSRIPAGFLSDYAGAVRARDAATARSRTEAALAATALFLSAPVFEPAAPIPAAVPVAADPAELVSFYEELLSAFNKLRVNVERGDWWMAFVNGCCVARELDGACADYGLPPLPFLDAYDADDLSAFGRRIEEVDAALTKAIEAFAPIRRHADFDSYLATR